jgi:hypothetical protein
MFERPSLRCDKFTTHKFADQRQSNSFQSLDSSPRQGKQIQMLTVERSPRWLFCFYADHDYHPPSTVYLCRTYEEPHKAAHFPSQALRLPHYYRSFSSCRDSRCATSPAGISAAPPCHCCTPTSAQACPTKSPATAAPTGWGAGPALRARQHRRPR